VIASATAAAALEVIEEELAAVLMYAAAADLTVDATELTDTNPRFRVQFRNAENEKFVAEIDCTDYPKYPPTIEFLDEALKARGITRLYPSGFHPMPCVCMRYNRKAYGERGGPHANDWRLVDWHMPTGGGIGIDTLAMIVSDLHSKIASSRGRLG
jgi:hypothetical protein